MIKRKHIIIASIILVLFIGLGIYIEIRRSQNETIQQTETQTDNETTTSDDEEIDESLEELGSDTHVEHVAPIVLNNKEITQAEITASYQPLAEEAAKQYLFQFTDESTKARQERLRAVFASNSPAITMPVPKVDTSNSVDITANPIVLNSTWDLNGNNLIVTVSLRVITRSNTHPRNEVSSVYQAYDVTFIQRDGNYLPHSIKFSDKPVIVSN